MLNGVSKLELKLTYDIAKDLWDYDPLEGTFAWKKRDVSTFRSKNHWLKYNESKVGTVCGTLTKRGYIVLGFGGSQYYAHRLAWLFSQGEWQIGRAHV